MPAKPIRKGLFSSELLARLVLEKYVLGRPLARIIAALRAEGLVVAKGGPVGALGAVSSLLEPLDQAIRARNAAAGHLRIDETSWQVFEDVEGKADHRWWLWVFVSADTICFDIDPTRTSSVLERHLGIDISAASLEPGRSLVVSSDFYSVSQQLATPSGPLSGGTRRGPGQADRSDTVAERDGDGLGTGGAGRGRAGTGWGRDRDGRSLASWPVGTLARVGLPGQEKTWTGTTVGMRGPPVGGRGWRRGFAAPCSPSRSCDAASRG
jgi:hypothetical protein